MYISDYGYIFCLSAKDKHADISNMKKNTLIDELVQIGFTENEGHIYITLLQHGTLKASEILQKTKLQRSVVYLALKNLIRKKLVYEKTDVKVARFAAHDPYRIVELQKQTVSTAESIASKLQRERTALEREAFVYEGNDIVTTVATKSLESKKGSTVYFLGPSKFGAQKDLEFFWQKYHALRESKGVHAKILYDQFVSKNILKQRNSYKTCSAKYLPLDIEVPISFVIWESHVAILVPGDNPPTVFFINSQQTADALVQYFEFMWKSS